MIKNGVIKAADLFCGAGGASRGLLMAAEAVGFDVDLLAINCWPIAIDTHSLNHPGVRHLCQTLETVKPREVIPEGHLDLLLASPECTHQSRARGGKPICDQSRSTAWRVIEWIEALDIDHVIIENVPEFQDWGPLDANNRPIKSKKGVIFKRYLSVIRAMGYTIEHRVLNAADFGDATTRKRLFIQARKSGKISWPEPTHIRPGQPRLELDICDAPPWRSAREIIDWSLEGESIYSRKRPLSQNTMRRILSGLQKYGGVPFITPNFGERDEQSPRCHSLEEPIPTVTSHGAGCLVQPYLVVLRNNTDATSVDGPVPTICAGGTHIALAEPFIVKSYLGSDAASLEAPLPTITANYEHLGLAKPVVVNMKGQSVGRDIDSPVPTVTAHSPHLYLAEPFLVSYHGNETGGHAIDEPLPTIDTRDRYALVSPELVKESDGEVIGWLDIRFRMLQPHELAAAMSFPADYHFSGTRSAQIKQIGNAVPVELAKALCKAALERRQGAPIRMKETIAA